MLARLLLLINLLLVPSALFAGELRYYVVDATPPSIAQDLLDLVSDKPEGFGGNTLSEVLSDDSTQVLIKVPNATSAIRTYVGENFTILRTYTKHDHRELIGTLNTHPNWSNARE